MCGLAGMALSLCVPAAGFWLRRGPALARMTASGWAAYVGRLAIALGPAFWLLISEIFPLAARGRGMSAATIANGGANLVVALTFLDLVNGMGRSGVFLAYAVLSFGALVFSFRLVPETKGKSLESIEVLWIRRAEGH